MRAIENGRHTRLLNIFNPGQGVMPPRLAGREEVMQVLNELLGRALHQQSAPPSDAVLYGPRGNGKTVLLSAFEEQCRRHNLDVLSLTPVTIKTEARLASRLLQDDSFIGRIVDTVAPDRLRLGAAEWRRMSPVDKAQYRLDNLDKLLQARCRERPLVVTLDEAHTLDTGVGQLLLNLSQDVRKQGAPFLLVLAGTPNLEKCLSKMSSTFWDRSEILGIGRLSMVATREALALPLRGHGVSVDEAALDTAVAESQQYPFFIQLWGQALCRTLVDRDASHVDMTIVELGRHTFRQRRDKYYARRYREFQEYDLLPAAIVAAQAFQDTNVLSEDALRQALAARSGINKTQVKNVIGRLADLGYIWCLPEAVHWEPGIPSLMNHLQAGVPVSGQSHTEAGQAKK